MPTNYMQLTSQHNLVCVQQNSTLDVCIFYKWSSQRKKNSNIDENKEKKTEPYLLDLSGKYLEP